MIIFAICDDDVEFSKKFAEIIKQEYKTRTKHDDEMIVFFYETGEELIKNYLKDNIDVVFMDIEIGKENGFNIAKKLVRIVEDLGIVYVTNHDYYATEAFVCRPLGFIRKNKVENDINRTLFSVEEFVSKKKREFVFMDGLKSIPVMLDKVRLVEVYNHDFIVVLKESALQMKDKLKRVESELKTNDFVKVSRNRMINLKFLKEIVKNECVLYDGDTFGISEDRVLYVKDSLMKYKIKH